MAAWHANLDYISFVHGALMVLVAAALWLFARAGHCSRQCHLVSGVGTRLLLASALAGLHSFVLCGRRLGADAAWCDVLQVALSAFCGWTLLDALSLLRGRRKHWASPLATVVAFAVLASIGAACVGASPGRTLCALGVMLLPSTLVAAAISRQGTCAPGCSRLLAFAMPLALSNPLAYTAGAGSQWARTTSDVAELASLCGAIVLAVAGLRLAMSRRMPGELLSVQLAARRRVVYITMAAIASTLLLALPALRVAERQQLRIKGRELADRVRLAADLLDADALAAIAPEPSAQGSAEYAAVRRGLAAVLLASPDCRHVQAMREVNGVPVSLVDPLPPWSFEFRPCGEVSSPLTPEAQAALRRESAAVEARSSTDQGGPCLSAYAPIRLPDGERAGIVGAELAPEQWLPVARRVRLGVLASALLLCLAIGALGAAHYSLSRVRAAFALHRDGLEAAEAAVAITDDSHSLVYANAAARRLCTCSCTESDDGVPHILGVTGTVARRAVQQALERDDRWQDELAWSTDTGDLRHYRLTITALHDSKGDVVGYVFVGFDTTQRRELETALRHSETDLLAANRRLAALLQEQCALTDRLSAQEHELARIAQTDQLTGLLNRRAFDQAVEKALHDAQARNRSFALAIVDLDHFKRVNDTFGHQVGDAVLERTASILRQSFRGSDVVCRYGGEEFAIVMPGTEADEGHEACERARAAIQNQTSLCTSTTPCLLPPVTITAGVAAYPTHASTVAHLLSAADVALYAGKNLGRNRVCVFRARGARRQAG